MSKELSEMGPLELLSELLDRHAAHSSLCAAFRADADISMRPEACGLMNATRARRDLARESVQRMLLAAGDSPADGNLLADSVQMADDARAKFGPHRSADFAACRVAEESGEFVAAATSQTNGRTGDRRERIYAEAVDTIAMVLRLVREFPNGSGE